MWCHGGVLSHFNWTIARIESGSWWAKDERNLGRSLSSIILSPEHQEWHVIEIARWNTNIARIVDPRRALNCQSCCYGIFAILHFVSGSHLTLQRNMSFRCLFVVMKSWDASFKGYFDKIYLIKLQHAKFNHEHSKCFDCRNDLMLENDMRWPNNFELIPPETEPHII